MARDRKQAVGQTTEFAFDFHCSCGASWSGTILRGRKESIDKVARTVREVWKRCHTKPGHYSVDSRRAAKARKEFRLDEDKRWRRANARNRRRTR